MTYKVKNITDHAFAFEGTNLQPGEVSLELPLDTYQRLLALNYGTALMPVEDGELAPEDTPATVAMDAVEKAIEEEEAVEEVSPEPTPAQEAAVEGMKEADYTTETITVPVEDTTASETQTVEIEVPAPAVAEVPVEAPKKRGRPRKNP